MSQRDMITETALGANIRLDVSLTTQANCQLVLCLINPFMNSEPRRRLSPPLAKGDFSPPVDSKSPLPPFSKGEYGKTDSEISQRISETLH